MYRWWGKYLCNTKQSTINSSADVAISDYTGKGKWWGERCERGIEGRLGEKEREREERRERERE